MFTNDSLINQVWSTKPTLTHLNKMWKNRLSGKLFKHMSSFTLLSYLGGWNMWPTIPPHTPIFHLVKWHEKIDLVKIIKSFFHSKRKNHHLNPWIKLRAKMIPYVLAIPSLPSCHASIILIKEVILSYTHL